MQGGGRGEGAPGDLQAGDGFRQGGVDAGHDGLLWVDDTNKKAANLCGVRGLFGEIDSLLLDQHTFGPDAHARSQMHSGRRRATATGRECIETMTAFWPGRWRAVNRGLRPMACRSILGSTGSPGMRSAFAQAVLLELAIERAFGDAERGGNARAMALVCIE
jgi:hypothetical protein